MWIGRLAGLLAGILVVGVAEAQAPPSSWQVRATGNGFTNGGFASDGTYFYTWGGNGGSQGHQRYSPATDTWSTLQSLPTYQLNPAGAHYNGFNYSFGQNFVFSPGTSVMGAVTKYNISTNTWSVVPNAATMLAADGSSDHATAAALGSKIYVFGGSYYTPGGGYYGPRAFTWEFDCVTEQVTQKASMPLPLRWSTSTGVPAYNKLYVLGGSGTGTVATNYEYDPALDRWTIVTPITVGGVVSPRIGARAFTLGPRVYLTGGSGSTYFSHTLEYSPGALTWSQVADMSQNRYSHGVAVVGSRVFAHGGYTNNGIPGSTEEFFPPDYGSAPQVSNLKQSCVLGEIPPGGRGPANITLGATITDPDPGQLVRLELQVKLTAAVDWNGAFGVVLPAQLAGDASRSVIIPQPGAMDWRARALDSYQNVGSWVEFSGSPDFISDQQLPGTPMGISPINVDLSVKGTNPLIPFVWTPVLDDGPIDQITYEIQLSERQDFATLEQTATVKTTSTQLPVSGALLRGVSKYWHVRAIDAGGNQGAWSSVFAFRVYLDDGIDHGAGDAMFCGISTSGTGGVGLGVLGAILLVAVLRRR